MEKTLLKQHFKHFIKFVKPTCIRDWFLSILGMALPILVISLYSQAIFQGEMIAHVLSMILSLSLFIGMAIWNGYSNYLLFESQIEKLNKRTTQKDLDISTKDECIKKLNDKLSDMDKVQEENFSLVRTKIAQEKQITTLKTDCGVSRRKLYESQLCGQFEKAITLAWNRAASNSPFLLEHYQGNHDQYLADFIGQIKSRYWLVEMKRELKNTPAEYKKPVRQAQYDQLIQAENEKLRTEVADKCHWLGWGCENEMYFYQYWIAKERINEFASSGIPLNVFIDRALDDCKSFGVKLDLFISYLKFLFKSYDKSDTDFWEAPIAIYQQKEDGQILREQMTFLELEKGYIVYKNLQLEKAKKLKLEQENNHEKSYGMRW